MEARKLSSQLDCASGAGFPDWLHGLASATVLIGIGSLIWFYWRRLFRRELEEKDN